MVDIGLCCGSGFGYRCKVVDFVIRLNCIWFCDEMSVGFILGGWFQERDFIVVEVVRNCCFFFQKCFSSGYGGFFLYFFCCYVFFMMRMMCVECESDVVIFFLFIQSGFFYNFCYLCCFISGKWFVGLFEIGDVFVVLFFLGGCSLWVCVQDQCVEVDLVGLWVLRLMRQWFFFFFEMGVLVKLFGCLVMVGQMWMELCVLMLINVLRSK